MHTALNAPQFQSADNARKYLETQVWPNGPICPHCGVISKDHYALKGKTTRPGLYKCKDCRKPFTVTVGTVFERSKIALNVWLQATFLMCSSKKGMSAHQLHRTLGVTYKTAWFMAHRIREAMTSYQAPKLLGGPGSSMIVEADETYWGNKRGVRMGRGSPKHKMKIVALVERGGPVRSYHVASVTGKNVSAVLLSQVAGTAHLMTDQAPVYVAPGREFYKHSTVNHAMHEYVRGDVHTNTIEGFFGILKRGLVGTYHHVSEAHLQRYCREFDFRYNHRIALGVNDAQRTNTVLKKITGKRLTYRRTDSEQAAF